VLLCGENMTSAFVRLLLLALQFSMISLRELELGPCFLSILEPCSNITIQFYLFRGDEPEEPPVLLDNASPILPLDYNETIARNFKMIIHGYGGHIDFSGSKKIRDGKFFFHQLQIDCASKMQQNLH
jgi:hypothetical protein